MVKNKISKFLKVNRKFLIAVLALLEVCVIFCAVTFSWIEGTHQGALHDTVSSVSAGDGLYFTSLDGAIIDNVSLPEVTLQDCSSMDGRNFFFPTSASKVDSSSSTLLYRAGNDADVNSKYISVDFNVVSFAQANLYIDSSSEVTCTNSNIKNALRISINFNDGSNPILLCGSDVGYNQDNVPVTSIKNDGTVNETSSVVAYAFSNYFVTGNQPVATLNGDGTKRITISVWLEGTDPDCTVEKINSSEISIKLILTTDSKFTKQVTFVDYTPNRWISDVPVGSTSSIKMFAIDKNTVTKDDYKTGTRYVMTPGADGITYTTKLPDTVTDVVFARFDPEDSGTSYNYWGATQTMGTSDRYYAIGRGASVDNQNYGYWVNDTVNSVVEVAVAKAPPSGQIVFTKPGSWSNVYAYFFDDNDTKYSGAWPGTQIETTYGFENDYIVRVPEGATKVVFNNGSNQNQTVDIDIGSYNTFYTTSYTTDSGNNKFSVERLAVKDIFSTSEHSPNIYFSTTYNTQLTSVGGIFNPSLVYSGANYGLNMLANDTSYSMILPADSIIKFNGNGFASSDINLSKVAPGKTKVLFKFTNRSTYNVLY